MNKSSITYMVVGVVAGMAIFLPARTYAAEVSFTTVPNTVVGDTTKIIDVWIKPGPLKLNVVEGVLALQGAAPEAASVDVSIEGSMLSLWPTPPSYDAKENVIRFTGGVPNGFTGEGLLFRLRVHTTHTGDLLLSWKSGMSYVNDGKGTKEAVAARSLALRVGDESTATTTVPTQQSESSESGLVNVITIVVLLVILALVLRYAYKKIFNT